MLTVVNGRREGGSSKVKMLRVVGGTRGERVERKNVKVLLLTVQGS